MNNIWFTGDTHFGHKRTLELSKRPFKTVEEMDEVLVKNWNNLIDEEDIVYHIGDFGDYEKSFSLNGKINLLFGNYERKDDISPEQLKNDYNFNNVLDSDYIKLLLFDKVVMLVHEPSHRDINTFTLFGHIHKLQMIKKNALNVGVDCHNFFPIDYETVFFYKNAIQNHYDEEVFSV